MPKFYTIFARKNISPDFFFWGGANPPDICPLTSPVPISYAYASSAATVYRPLTVT